MYRNSIDAIAENEYYRFSAKTCQSGIDSQQNLEIRLNAEVRIKTNSSNSSHCNEAIKTSSESRCFCGWLCYFYCAQ